MEPVQDNVGSRDLFPQVELGPSRNYQSEKIFKTPPKDSQEGSEAYDPGM